LRVLHLTPWYPTERAPHAVPFIKAHFDAVRQHGRHRLIHVEVATDGDPAGFSIRFGPDDGSRVILRGYRGPTRFLEWLTLAMLLLVRTRLGRQDWDVVAIHVAWPLYRFPRAVRALFGAKVVLVEHWSAYSRDFYLDPGSRAHARMRRMFSTDAPVIAVSQGLAADISRFAQRGDLNISIVPNVVSEEFHYEDHAGPLSIFMAANWNDFRKPFLVLSAMPELMALHPELRLVVAGGGAQLPAMRAFVANKPWAARVRFLGFVDREAIAREMRQASIFCHPTIHETFSVVTAEAMCCGVPAVVSNVGAVPELVVHGKTGLLVENDEQAWRAALLGALHPATHWDRHGIAEHAGSRFSAQAVGRQLADVLREVAAR